MVKGVRQFRVKEICMDVNETELAILQRLADGEDRQLFVMRTAPFRIVYSVGGETLEIDDAEAERAVEKLHENDLIRDVYRRERYVITEKGRRILQG